MLTFVCTLDACKPISTNCCIDLTVSTVRFLSPIYVCFLTALHKTPCFSTYFGYCPFAMTKCLSKATYEGKVILAHGSRIQSVMFWSLERQYHIIFAIRKQRTMDACTQLPSPTYAEWGQSPNLS